MSTHHVEEKGEPLHCLIKMEIALRADACDVVPSLSRKREISSYFLLIPDLTAESAIPASAKLTHGDYMNWVRPPISIASETPKSIFMPLDRQQ